MKKVIELLLEKVLYIALFIGFLILDQLTLLIAILWRFHGKLSTIQYYELMIIAFIILFIFIFYALRNRLLRLKGLLSKQSIIVIVIGFILMISVSYIGSYFLHMAGIKDTSNQQDIIKTTSEIPVSLMFLIAVISGPMMEEIMFRYIIPKKIFAGHQKIGFVLGTLLFAILHGPSDFISFLIYAGMGTILSYVFYKYNRLEYGIIIHTLNNALGFIGIITGMIFSGHLF